MHGTQIDIALTPAASHAVGLLAHVRKGDVQAVHSLRRGVARRWRWWHAEITKPPRVVGREVGSLSLPA